MHGPRDEYDYYDEWLSRDDEDRNISLDEYEEMRSCEDYGDDCYFDDDDDSNDRYYYVTLQGGAAVSAAPPE